jgi:hypothetical protein
MTGKDYLSEWRPAQTLQNDWLVPIATGDASYESFPDREIPVADVGTGLATDFGH